MSIYEKLLIAQAELKSPKSQYNSFGKYKYRNCEDILESLKPILAKIKATVIISDEIVNIASRFYVKATARLIDTENGEHLEATAYAREEESKKGMDSSQVTGASSSYARKYALNGLFAIDDTKDADTFNHHDQNHKPKKDNMIELRAELNTLITEYSKLSNKEISDISSELVNVVNAPLKKITEVQGRMLVSYLNGKINKLEEAV